MIICNYINANNNNYCEFNSYNKILKGFKIGKLYIITMCSYINNN